MSYMKTAGAAGLVPGPPASGARCRLPVLCASLLLVASAAAAPAQAPLEAPFDVRRWAAFLVGDVLDVQPHERYLLLADPGYFPDFIDALRAELIAARAVEVGMILFDGPGAAERRSEVRPRTSDEEYRPTDGGGATP